MKHFFILLRHEIGVLLINPATYIATVVFLVLMGYLFQTLLAEYAHGTSDASPAIDFFRLWFVPACALTPLLTMHSLADERRRGTIETLLTTPVTSTEVVLAKFFSSYFFYLLLWGSTVAFYWVLYRFAENPGAIDSGPLVGGYTFAALSGLMFIATGIFASALTRSQLVAALIAFTINVVLIIGFSLPRFLSFDAGSGTLFASAIEHVQIFQHAEDFLTGVFDTRAPVLYLSMTGLWLFLSILALDARSARA